MAGVVENFPGVEETPMAIVAQVLWVFPVLNLLE